MGLLFLIDEKEVQTHPPQWDGLGGSKKEEGNEGAAPVPADLHPPLNKTKVAKVVGEVRNSG